MKGKKYASKNSASEKEYENVTVLPTLSFSVIISEFLTSHLPPLQCYLLSMKIPIFRYSWQHCTEKNMRMYVCTNMFVRYQQCKIFYKTPFCREHYDISETPSSKKGQIHLPFKVELTQFFLVMKAYL